jgi:acyl-CoA synthetase (AMP-forming)/AMP-acid ligase II
MRLPIEDLSTDEARRGEAARDEMAGAAARPDTIPRLVHWAAAKYGDTEALVGQHQRLTYRSLETEVAEIARALIASGIGPGDRVSILAPNSPIWVTTSLAVYATGATLVPVNTRFKSPEIAHVLRAAGCKMLFTVTDFLGVDYAEMLEGVGDLHDLEETVILDGPVRDGLTTWASFLSRGESTPAGELALREAAIEPENASDIIFTSGTTGQPKGAVLSHGASLRTYVGWANRVGLRHGDRYLVVYPFFHTAGMKGGVLASLLCGATVVPHAVFDVPSVLRLVQEERITVLPGPPTVFLSIMNDPGVTKFDLSSLRLSVTGAATTPVEVVRRMREELQIERIVTGYGLTETHGTVSVCHYTDSLDVVATTVGPPLDGIEVRVLDDHDRDLPAGEPGEIVVRGFNVMEGYFNDPAATAGALFEDGWLRTGDIGIVGSEGYLRITDRKKDMFIVGGFNAYPAEIEGILLRHPAIAQTAVIGIPDDRLGEVGMAFVMLRPGQELDEDSLIAWCRDQMANFKVPRRVKVVNEFPLNPSGKVMKFRLREQVEA